MKKEPILLYTKVCEIFWDDMDAYGHVSSAKYFIYMQECRICWLNHVGIKFLPGEKAPVISYTSCKFIHPILYPATIAVELYSGPRKGKKFTFTHIIRDQNNPELIYAIGEAESVWFDFITNRSIEEPEEYKHLIP
jgi:acyl-CoA thioester hydrolase